MPLSEEHFGTDRENIREAEDLFRVDGNEQEDEETVIVINKGELLNTIVSSAIKTLSTAYIASKVIEE